MNKMFSAFIFRSEFVDHFTSTIFILLSYIRYIIPFSLSLTFLSLIDSIVLMKLNRSYSFDSHHSHILNI